MKPLCSAGLGGLLLSVHHWCPEINLSH